METETILKTLDRITPFRFLRIEEKTKLASRLSEDFFAKNEIIIRQGEEKDDVFLLVSGSVEAVDRTGSLPVRFNTIEEGHYFGEFEVLFRCPRLLEIRALEDCRCLRLSGVDFLELLVHRQFAQPLGAILRERQGIFAGFERFRAELMRGITRGHVNLSALLPLYIDIEPALHPFAKDRAKIDVSGLLYAVRRLPDNVTCTFVYLLADEIPPVFAEADSLFRPVKTEARVRFIWEIMPGKNLVLLRSGLSDLFDFATCLCLFAVEAGKIRTRLCAVGDLMKIKGFLESRNEKGSEEIVSFLAGLGFSREEAEGLHTVWGSETVMRVNDLVRHREVFTVDVRRQRNSYHGRRSELWTEQIGEAARTLVGRDPTALPEDVRVHIVSSNTHSVINCLNPWLVTNRDRVFAWAKESSHPFMKDEWHDEFDLLYALSRNFFSAHPGAAAEIREAEKGWGIVRLKETASTGIQVQMIDGARLAGLPLDPGIVPPRKDSHEVIVNIDYAFGEQAEHVIRNLLMLFGRNVASVNFLGKAGALLGSRGDILAPTAFIKQNSERYEPLPVSSVRCKPCLLERIPGRRIHEGPMLTVDGTLLQNRKMLYFYKHVWGCVGIEMEGAYYYRQVLESIRLGIIPAAIALRFYYYVSDLPLEHASNLSSRMSALEGVPPLYAVTREILAEIFE